MKTNTETDATTTSSSSPCLQNIIDHHLPLRLLRSDIVTPAPTFSNSTIDFLPHFAGYSWIAYGASSILTITHFPSPLSSHQTRIGPIFRQFFELSDNHSSPVSSVSWSPQIPSSGYLAASAQNCIWVFHHDSLASKGSFCWSQNAVLVQRTKVETIRWTGSGDGIISGGMEVVFWKKSNRCWEIAWKFNADQPQTLVSATWSISGPSATAARPSKEQIEGSLISQGSKCVLVCQSNGLSEYSKVKLQHPLPIVTIQWRPSSGKLSNRYGRYSKRNVLLTCCLDGTARLWSEIDNGKAKRVGKNTGCSFCVIAVIEISQCLNGTLGSDIFVTWGTETEGLVRRGEGDKLNFSKEGFEHDVRKCDWLVGFGPGLLLSFWAVHCLDDVSPLRFPRVTLWRKHELQSHDIGNIYKFDSSDFKNALLLHKVIISRNSLSGPPSICSPLQLLPCNSLVWSFFNFQEIRDAVESSLDNGKTDKISSHLTGGSLNLDGHSEKILKVSIHPYTCEAQVAASLDSNGLLLFWSLSNISNSILGCPTLVPTWELCGKLATKHSCSMYTSLTWAPSILDEQLVFFMGHTRGVDCFIVNISRTEEENMECHYLCTIPFTGHGPYEDGPHDIFANPLNSTCNKTFRNNKLMLLAIWTGRFQALSWEVNLHSFDMSTSCCECNFDAKSLDENSVWAFESTFASKRYCITVIPCSSKFPNSNDVVTSFAVADPGTPSHNQEFGFANDLCSSCPTYIMATGCSDGSLKLWKTNRGNPLTLHLPWELVGMFIAHNGPVKGICFTDCGQKVATFCNENDSSAVNTIHIWDAVNLIISGTFILEDTLMVESDVITLKWLNLGTGELLLGVCLQNELQVYAQKRYAGLSWSNSVNFPKLNVWSHIAFARTSLPINDFLWGPRAAAVVVHGNYFSIFSHWLFHVDKMQRSNFRSHNSDPIAYNCKGETSEDISSAIFTDCDIGASGELSIGDSHADCDSKLSITNNVKDNNLSSSLFLAKEQLKYELHSKVGLWSILEVAERISGSLPTYHPNVLLTNISSGNWKRAYVAVKHLVEWLISNYDPIKAQISKRNGLPSIVLSDYLEGRLSKSSQDKGFNWSGDVSSIASFSQAQSSSIQFSYQSDSSAENKSSSTSTRSELIGFIQSLEKFPDLPCLTNIERTEILSIIDLLSEVSNLDSSSAYQSLDEPGRRFWVALRFQQLLFQRKFGRAGSVEELFINSRLFVWAYHSDSKENLFGSVVPNEPSWQEMRALGMGFWYANIPQLRARMEKLARAQYLKNKNPKDCALLYIALNRIQVLAGLFKISRDEKDKPLVAFLSRNFQDEKNKGAALKNAYVLLGKHQLELAVAFFLLGGDHSSAINVCAKNLGDEQLALVICRLVEGHGGPLERHLITKYIYPSATDRGDYWLASLLEWEMGNCYQSFHRMLEFSVNNAAPESTIKSNSGSFLDPTVGFYCQMLVTKNSTRNAVGEQNSAVLLRWATLMTVTALKRCGIPLEALEYFTSSLSMLGTADQENELGDVLSSTLKPLPRKSSNWLSADVSVHLEFHVKLNLALCYLSKLIREHPSWPDTFTESDGDASYSEDYMIQYEKSNDSFKQKLHAGFDLFEQRFSLTPCYLISMILLLLSHHGLWYIGYDVTDGSTQGELFQKKRDRSDVSNLSHSQLFKSLFKTAEEISFLYSRFFSACGMEYSQQSSTLEKDASQCHFEAWLHRNSEALLFMVQPFLIARDGCNPYEVDMVNLKKLIPKVAQLLAQNSFITNIENLQVCAEDKLGADIKCPVPDDERWKILGTCLWQHMSRFMISNLNLVLAKLEDENLSGSFHRYRESNTPSNMNHSPRNMDFDNIDLPEQILLVTFSLCDLLTTTVTHISSYHVKQLAQFLWQKLENDSNDMTLEWLKQTSQSVSNQHEVPDFLELMNRKDNSLVHQLLWDHCANPKLIRDCFAQEKLNWSKDLNQKPTKGWNDLYTIMTGLYKTDEVGSPVKGTFPSGHASARSNQKDIICANIDDFQSPREVYKRNGELLEALCINSTNHQEAAVASNRKGIVFFHLEDEIPFSGSADHLWTKADWPQNGWAGSESTPAPTCVSPGVGLGSKKGAHLGLGGATVGMDSSAWPSRDLIGGGALGMPGYAGIGASGLGWETQQDFEDFVDPLATLENTSTRAFSSHPMRPFFLVGSSNTHIYLWEADFVFMVPCLLCKLHAHSILLLLMKFNKDKATATYGVLPAANVPPPYALASISALQFDHFGHRFASAALDGTVCTWQLEVGGRSNVRPIESSLCFNGQASDVTYVSSSGSIIAVAGYSSNGINVVIWDTLAPPSTSRASILCHEGGARSLSVFDNQVGSGSVSPLIVTGGKDGDVGLHDFRYIVTGKAKRHKRSDSRGPSSPTSLNYDKDHNVDGMLWYIPKAHSGSVTKIATIPNTSLFLTGSTDGDVKLWDVESSKLIHHWPKIHEKHTFLQSGSRGFGGVVRAAVTDIQVVPHGFLTCGGDGNVKLVQLKSHLRGFGDM
ncbi:hypothetical protein L195_g000661 [Trifolium pratense]|uniref:Ig-like domain-containing protein n=1 Tax=Trifolium pratense TaxID=57577 RepID=A0A2K3NMI3_TRIPR|nr:hypothetical protein L195_g000661 [Trifolium pratense]